MGLKDKRWFKVVKDLAPKVAVALGGPYAGLAGAVLEAVTGKNEKEIEEAVIAGDPAIYAEIKKAEIEFDARMAEIGLKEEQLAYEDIASARSRQIAMKDHTPAVLTGVALTFFFALSASVLYNLDIVQENQAFVMFLFGAASGWVTQGMSYFLGSSKGSQRKTDILANGK
jgi:hypothetical protein